MDKKPRGRPSVSESDRLKEQIIFRTTAGERAAIERAAELADMKLSDWIRSQLIMAARRQTKRRNSA